MKLVSSWSQELEGDAAGGTFLKQDFSFKITSGFQLFLELKIKFSFAKIVVNLSFYYISYCYTLQTK